MQATSRLEHPASPEQHIGDAIAAFQKGIDRQENFELLVARFYSPVLRYLSRWPLSEEDRLDITQEVFLKVYKGLKGFRGDALFSTWIFSIAHNTCMRWFMRNPHARTSDELDPTESSDVADEAPLRTAETLLGDQLEGLIARESVELLHRAIAELPTQMRRCVQLQVYQDLRLHEIAAVLRLSTGTVKAHLFQAREKLRARLRGPLAHEGPL